MYRLSFDLVCRWCAAARWMFPCLGINSQTADRRYLVVSEPPSSAEELSRDASNDNLHQAASQHPDPPPCTSPASSAPAALEHRTLSPQGRLVHSRLAQLSSRSATSSSDHSRASSPSVKVEPIVPGKWTHISARVAVRPLTKEEADSLLSKNKKKKRHSRKGSTID